MSSPDTIKRYVSKNFQSFGINKAQQVTRLLYEISKRESIPFKRIIKDGPQRYPKFPNLKKYLIKRRFPVLMATGEKVTPYLPELGINPQYKVKIRKCKIMPKNIYIEEEVSKGYLARRFKEKFPKTKCINIPSLKEYIKGKRFGIEDYNKRRDNFFIIREKFDFFKHCPCTTKAASCGYHILNLGVGCAFECTYCYLQEYINSPGIIIPANIEDFFSAFEKYKHNIRLGTGEFTDSLALDDITEFSLTLVEFFRKYPQTVFELKTKSDNVKTLISSKPSKNVVIAWSLNPQSIIDDNEFYSTSLHQRFKAALQCIDADFKIGFHFDPIICYNGWEKDYEEVINQLFDKISDKHICWISLGTLRFSRRLKKIIENRFPKNHILDGELFPGLDRKMRYSERVRINVYKKMNSWIRKRSKNVYIYLCMENKAVWKECRMPPLKSDVWQKLIK